MERTDLKDNILNMKAVALQYDSCSCTQRWLFRQFTNYGSKALLQSALPFFEQLPR